MVTDNAQYYRWSVLKLFGVKHENYHEDHYMIFFPKNESGYCGQLAS